MPSNAPVNFPHRIISEITFDNSFINPELPERVVKNLNYNQIQNITYHVSEYEV